jgi:hypothetical protein
LEAAWLGNEGKIVAMHRRLTMRVPDATGVGDLSSLQREGLGRARRWSGGSGRQVRSQSRFHRFHHPCGISLAA